MTGEEENMMKIGIEKLRVIDDDENITDPRQAIAMTRDEEIRFEDGHLKRLTRGTTGEQSTRAGTFSEQRPRDRSTSSMPCGKIPVAQS